MTAPTRDDAWALLCEWTQSESLRKHALAVEAAVGWYARHRFGIDGAGLETWRAAGLLHDFDYERHPDTHPVEGAAELRRRGYPEGSSGPSSRTAITRACRARRRWRGPSTPATR